MSQIMKLCTAVLFLPSETKAQTYSCLALKHLKKCSITEEITKDLRSYHNPWDIQNAQMLTELLL